MRDFGSHFIVKFSDFLFNNKSFLQISICQLDTFRKMYKIKILFKKKYTLQVCIFILLKHKIKATVCIPP